MSIKLETPGFDVTVEIDEDTYNDIARFEDLRWSHLERFKRIVNELRAIVREINDGNGSVFYKCDVCDVTDDGLTCYAKASPHNDRDYVSLDIHSVKTKDGLESDLGIKFKDAYRRYTDADGMMRCFEKRMTQLLRGSIPKNPEPTHCSLIRFTINGRIYEHCHMGSFMRIVWPEDNVVEVNIDKDSNP